MHTVPTSILAQEDCIYNFVSPHADGPYVKSFWSYDLGPGAKWPRWPLLSIAVLGFIRGGANKYSHQDMWLIKYTTLELILIVDQPLRTPASDPESNVTKMHEIRTFWSKSLEYWCIFVIFQYLTIWIRLKVTFLLKNPKIFLLTFFNGLVKLPKQRSKQYGSHRNP